MLERTNHSRDLTFEEASCGPKMAACSEKERRFVWHYLMLGGVAGSGVEAARVAGYKADNAASQVLQRVRVLDALDEVGRRAFRSLMIPAVIAAARLIENSKHPKHAAVVLSTLSRLGLVERTGVDVNVSGEVQLTHTQEAVVQLKALKAMGVPQERLEALFGYSGLARYETLLLEAERGKVIDVEAAGEKSQAGSEEDAAPEQEGRNSGRDSGS
jgi:hypothetical protein